MDEGRAGSVSGTEGTAAAWGTFRYLADSPVQSRLTGVGNAVVCNGRGGSWNAG